MATPSEVKAGLDDVAQEIRTSRQALKDAQARVQAAKSDLANIPTKYADLITTIDGYAGGNEFEAQAVADKNALAGEFNALEVKATNANADLQAYDFSS